MLAAAGRAADPARPCLRGGGAWSARALAACPQAAHGGRGHAVKMWRPWLLPLSLVS